MVVQSGQDWDGDNDTRSLVNETVQRVLNADQTEH
jgi:hypothetical protein